MKNKPSFVSRIKSAYVAFVGAPKNAYPGRTRSPVRFYTPTEARQEISSYDRKNLIRYGRNWEINSGFINEMLNAYSAYVVGDGMQPQPRSVNQEWNKKARKVFERLTTHPEISGMIPFWKVQDIIGRRLCIDGEVFCVKTEDENGFPKLQILEAHRILQKNDKTRGIEDGIRFDKFGRPVSYFFSSGEGETEVLACDVFHVFIATRFSQTHGTPTMQHSFNAVHDAQDLDEIEIATDKLINGYGVTIESEAAVQEASEIDGIDPLGESNTTPPPPRNPLPFEKIGAAQTVLLNPGDKANVIESNRPSPAWLGLRDAIDQAAALGNIPLGFISDPSKLGGAAARLVVAKAARYFSQRQQEIIFQFLNKAWLFFIGWAIEHGELEAVEDWHRVEWTTPRRLTVDNGRDSAQIRADVQAGLIPIQDDFGERALNFEDEVDARIEVIKTIREKCDAAGINPELVVPILFQQKPAAEQKTINKE